MTLKEKMQAKLARRKQIMQASEGRDLTAEETAELQAIAAACQELKALIEQDAQLQALDAEFNQGAGRRSGADVPGGRVPGGDPEAMGGFDCAASYFQAVRLAADGVFDPRLQRVESSDAMSNDGNYGFMVPTEISSQVFSVFQEDTGDLLSLVDSGVTGASVVMIPKDVANPWDAAGIKSYWEQSGEPLKLSQLDETTGKTMKLYPLSVFVKIHEDLFDDAPQLVQKVMELAPQNLRWELNEAIRNASGAGKITGYRKSKAVITIPKENGQAAKTVVAENILKMVECLPEGAEGRAIWLINKRLRRQLRMLKDSAGNPLWSKLDQPLVGAAPATLEDIPIFWDTHAEAVGSEGDIQLIVPSGYCFKRRTAREVFMKSVHLDFDKALQAFRWRFRIGGMPYLDKPLKDAKGDGETSHFIQLAARV